MEISIVCNLKKKRCLDMVVIHELVSSTAFLCSLKCDAKSFSAIHIGSPYQTGHES